MTEALSIGGLTFEVRRSPRRRTLGITVDRGGELVLHAPVEAAEEELAGWARSKFLWVHRKLALKEETLPRVREPEFVAGETFRYLGRGYRLVLVADQEEPLRFDGHRFSLRRDARGGGAEHFLRWYIQAGTGWIVRRVGLLSPRLGAAPARVEVRELGFRWGSCTQTGGVHFNWRLLQLPVRVTDSIVIHELAHLREPHHGEAFRALLDRALPDWRERRTELGEAAKDAYWCHSRMAQ